MKKTGKRRHIETRIFIAFVDKDAFLSTDDGSSFAKAEKRDLSALDTIQDRVGYPNLPLSRRRDNDGYL